MGFRLSADAQADVADALDWSLANFGEDAFRRYSKLLRVSFRDIVEDPLRLPKTPKGLRMSAQGS